MKNQWTLRGAEFSNCSCAHGCPCQFNAPSTHGYCHAIGAGHVEEGHFNETRLDGLNFVMLLKWPGEIADGNGQQQIIIDERADAAQREALRKILHGESTAPGATHFFVFNSTMSEVLDTLYAPVEVEIDVEACRGRRARSRTRRIARLADRRPPHGRGLPGRHPSAERLRVHPRLDGKRQLPGARGARDRALEQLRPVQRPAHEPGRRDPLGTRWPEASPPLPPCPAATGSPCWLASLGVTALAWVYLVVMAGQMDSMAGMASMPLRPWSRTDFLLMFLMWAVMMVGMMVPSATPMALIYAAVARKAQRQGASVAPTFVFVAGYVAVWTLFSLFATLAQWGLERLALLSPMMVTTSPAFGGALLVAAGLYQLTPAKDACLRHCRSPAQFFASHWRPGLVGAFRLGVTHGVFCLGCCWLLMALLFFGGVMNLLWIAAITTFVLLEKLLPSGHALGRATGVGLVIMGGLIVTSALRS